MFSVQGLLWSFFTSSKTQRPSEYSRCSLQIHLNHFDMKTIHSVETCSELFQLEKFILIFKGALNVCCAQKLWKEFLHWKSYVSDIKNSKDCQIFYIIRVLWIQTLVLIFFNRKKLSLFKFFTHTNEIVSAYQTGSAFIQHYNVCRV